jgi:hypothetical protein
MLTRPRAFADITNTVENFFSIFKRGIVGIYHHVSAAHLSRYATELDSAITTATRRTASARMRRSAAFSASASPIGGLTRSSPNIKGPAKVIGERRKRYFQK